MQRERDTNENISAKKTQSLNSSLDNSSSGFYIEDLDQPKSRMKVGNMGAIGKLSISQREQHHSPNSYTIPKNDLPKLEDSSSPLLMESNKLKPK